MRRKNKEKTNRLQSTNYVLLTLYIQNHVIKTLIVMKLSFLSASSRQENCYGEPVNYHRCRQLPVPNVKVGIFVLVVVKTDTVAVGVCSTKLSQNTCFHWQILCCLIRTHLSNTISYNNGQDNMPHLHLVDWF